MTLLPVMNAFKFHLNLMEKDLMKADKWCLHWTRTRHVGQGLKRGRLAD
jgi:hypothetical protein